MYWRASTLEMRPDTDPDPDFLAFLEDERKADPVSYDSEYGAEFRRDIESYISLEQVQGVIVPGRSMLPYDAALTHFAFIDVAGGGGAASAALTVTRRQNDRAAVCRVCEWRPPFSATTVAGEVSDVLGEYNVTTLVGDEYSGETWQDI